MNFRKCPWLTFLIAGGSFFCLVFDSTTALGGAADGIKICLQTIVPTLLPYIFLSSLMAGSLSGKNVPLIKPLGHLCGVPDGAEAIFLLGLLGGYPVGARLITEAYQSSQLSRPAAKRMTAFCNNAGPSFILGMLSSIFSRQIVPWLLWLIHIISAILVGMLITCNDRMAVKLRTTKVADPSAILLQTIKSLSLICGWVILFRMLIAFIHKWFLLYLSPTALTILTGILELANGCIALQTIPNEVVRFIACSCLLAFGGLCVMMQTHSVCGNLGLGMYLTGKIVQTFISFLVALPTGYLIYGLTPDIWFFLCISTTTVVVALAVVTYLKSQKKVVAIP